MSSDADGRGQIARAAHLLAVERYDDAARLLATVVAAAPDDTEALTLLARAELGRGQLGRARAAAERCTALEPDDAGAHRLLATVLQEIGEGWAALPAADRAVRLGPWDWRNHHAYATTASALPGRAMDAAAAAARTLELAPTEPAAHFVVGLAAQRRKDHATARTAYGHVLRLEPTHAAALNNLTVLDGSRHLGRAARGYGRVLSIEPQQETARGNVEMLVRRFAVRLYYGAALAFLVALVVRGAGGEQTTTPDGGSDLHDLHGTPLGLASYAVALVSVVVVVGYVARLLTTIPPGVRAYARSRAVRDPRAAVRLALAVVLLGAALATSLVPAAIDVTPALILPIAAANAIAFLVLRRSR